MYCCVPFCTSKTSDKKRNKSVSYHEFPSNTELRIKWIKALGKIDPKTNKLWVPTDFSLVCSKHFEKSCIKTSSSYVIKRHPYLQRLVPGSVPTIFSHHKKIAVKQLRNSIKKKVDEPTTSSDSFNPVNHSTTAEPSYYTKEDVDEPTTSSNSFNLVNHSTIEPFYFTKKEVDDPTTSSYSFNPVNHSTTAELFYYTKKEVDEPTTTSNSFNLVTHSTTEPFYFTQKDVDDPTTSSNSFKHVNHSTTKPTEPFYYTKEEVDGPTTYSDSFNPVNHFTITDNLSLTMSPIRTPATDTDTQSVTDKNESNSISQVSETNSRSGSLFQPPVLIKDEIIVSSEDELCCDGY